jgi:hypothetical protein
MEIHERAAIIARRFWDTEHEGRTFDDWWCSREVEILERWPVHRQRLGELYNYLDKRYFDNHPTPLKRCDAANRVDTTTQAG